MLVALDRASLITQFFSDGITADRVDFRLLIFQIFSKQNNILTKDYTRTSLSKVMCTISHILCVQWLGRGGCLRMYVGITYNVYTNDLIELYPRILRHQLHIRYIVCFQNKKTD